MGFLDDRASLEGKVAMVLGGGGGLGKACAADLARAGVNVAVADRDDAALSHTVAEISEGGGQVMAGLLDTRDPDALSVFFLECDERFGNLHILVNVVGGTFRQLFSESQPRGREALMRTNFTWLLDAISLAIPRMRDVGGGSIINLTSIEAHRAAPGFAVYAAMKAAIESLTRTLAVELGPTCIRVNTIAPDFVPTEGIQRIAGEDDETEALATRLTIPMGRRGTYEDVGSCALFLASGLSTYVTGTTLHPDGGALAAAGWSNWPGDGFRTSPPGSVLESLMRKDDD